MEITSFREPRDLLVHTPVGKRACKRRDKPFFIRNMDPYETYSQLNQVSERLLRALHDSP